MFQSLRAAQLKALGPMVVNRTEGSTVVLVSNTMVLPQHMVLLFVFPLQLQTATVL